MSKHSKAQPLWYWAAVLTTAFVALSAVFWGGYWALQHVGGQDAPATNNATTTGVSSRAATPSSVETTTTAPRAEPSSAITAPTDVQAITARLAVYNGSPVRVVVVDGQACLSYPNGPIVAPMWCYKYDGGGHAYLLPSRLDDNKYQLGEPPLEAELLMAVAQARLTQEMDKLPGDRIEVSGKAGQIASALVIAGKLPCDLVLGIEQLTQTPAFQQGLAGVC